ncbi:hypothetical protein EBT16_11375, partial [bacterium]|nr:hypothetical protein [bacterium]
TIIISSSHSLYRLTDLFLFSSYFSSFHFFAAKIEKKARESEEALRDSIKKALTNIHQAIRVKSLGWYSRGLLPSDESIWQLTAEQILAIESQLE